MRSQETTPSNVCTSAVWLLALLLTLNVSAAGDNKHLHLYVTTQTSIAAVDVKTSSKVRHPEAVLSS